MNIVIASDHAGFDLKKHLIEIFNKENIQFSDLGCTSSDEAVDYPDYANILAEKLKNNTECFGILICGSGVGISIAANRHKHIRAALCFDTNIAMLARLHNNANVLCLGARVIDFAYAAEIVKIFLSTKFEGKRHEKRVSKLSN